VCVSYKTCIPSFIYGQEVLLRTDNPAVSWIGWKV